MTQYTTKKIAAKTIFKGDKLSEIKNAVSRTHQIISHALNLIYLFYLSYERDHQEDPEELNLPLPDYDLLQTAFRIVSTVSKSGTVKDQKLQALLEDTYQKRYRTKFKKKLPSRDNLTQILTYAARQLETNIKNNITSQFIKRLNQQVNEEVSLKGQITYIDEYEEISKEEKEEKKKALRKTIYQV